MGLTIQTTGLEQFSPGGGARVKILLIGGPGVGKTRFASYWPKPIYLDCEGGLASVADRKVPFVAIKSSQDMLDALDYLKRESLKPDVERKFQTVIIDTLDAFQRKVKDEWLQAHPGEESFRGFDAWGYLDAKMQMLMTRLLNLDLNVYVSVHYSDKTIKEGVGADAKERQEFMLQLSGSIKDQAFNDFDLVGWMGTYYEAIDGQRVQKRGITFKATPEKPFLKDRLHITPAWLEVTFHEDDYFKLWAKLLERLDELGETEEIGEIPTSATIPTGGVVSPATVASAPLPEVDPKEVPLTQFDKATLAQLCRTEGCTTMPDGTPIKGNTLKSEMVKALEHHRAKAKDAAQADAPAPAEAPAPEETPAAPAVAEEPAEAPRVAPEATPAPVTTSVETVEQLGETVEVDTATGAVVGTVEATPEQAVASVEEVLGGTVVEEAPTSAPEPTPAPAPTAAPAAGQICEECGTDLTKENQDFVRLSYIKHRRRLCEQHYKEAKAKAGR